MVSILPGSIAHHPFHKINPKHFNFDTAEVWPELHRVPIFWQSNTQMYRVYFTSILIPNHVHIIQEQFTQYFYCTAVKVSKFSADSMDLILYLLYTTARGHESIFLSTFFAFQTTKGSFFLSFSLKGQYKALCNNFLLEQYSVHSFLLEKNESTPQVKKLILF